MIQITQIKKVQGELNIPSLHLLCNALLVAKVDADKRIEFVPGIYLYPPVLKQILDVAENFKMISSSLPESQYANPNHPPQYGKKEWIVRSKSGLVYVTGLTQEEAQMNHLVDQGGTIHEITINEYHPPTAYQTLTGEFKPDAG